MHISEMEGTIQRMSFVFEIMALQVVAWNSACSDWNTCHRELICQQTVLRFQIKLKQTLSYSIYLEFMRKWVNIGAELISAVFGTR